MEEAEATEFKVGQQVEVAGEFSNTHSWYSAKVIATLREFSSKKQLLVEYESLKSAKHRITPLRKTIDVTRVRPRPPEIPPRTLYHLNQVVDVYFAKGWWKGKIIEILEHKDLSYRVVLDSPTLSNPQMHVKVTDLRIHQDWVFGCWPCAAPKLQQQQIQQQIEGLEKQTTTISDRTGGESKEIVPEASVEGVLPENQLASHSNLSIRFSEVSDKDREVYISFDLANCSMNLEGQINNGDQCYMTIEDEEHEIVMHVPYSDEVTLLNRNGEHETGMHDLDCDEMTPENTNREHEAIVHDPNCNVTAVKNRNGEHESVTHDYNCNEMTPGNRKVTVFTKSYSLWKDIEEMEEILLMPQQPHFQPLKEINGIFREGKAIGYMLSFANLVKKTSRATLDEPKSTFETMLKALNVLEAAGLHVQQVRHQVEELLQLKEKQLQIHDMLKECERQIIKEKHEEELLKSQISIFDRKLLEINKARQVVELEHNTKSASVTALERQHQDLMEEMQGTTHKFNLRCSSFVRQT